MPSTLDRKLFRDLYRLKGQVITIALVVAAGIATYVTLQSTFASLDDTRDRYYERYRFADVFAYLERAPSRVAERIADIPGVAVAYTRVVEDVMLPVADLAEPATGHIVSIPSGGDIPLNGLFLRSGRLPEPHREDEAVVIESFARAHSLSPGDHLPAVINGKRRDLLIVGVALSPEYVFTASLGDFAPDDRKLAILWMDRDVLAPAFQMDGAFNDVTLRLSPGASTTAVIEALDHILEPYGGLGAIPRDKQVSNYMLNGELTQLESYATVMPLIFLAVAAFLLNVVLARTINLQRQQIAVLKALGYGNLRIGLHYLELVSIIVIAGALVGVAVGGWLGRSMTSFYGTFLRFPTHVYKNEYSVAAVAVLISLGAALLGALGAVRRVARLPPAEAMRPPAPARYKVSFVERLGLTRLLGPSAMMVVRELFRHPLRAILSSLGIAAAVGILIVGRFGYDSFEYLQNTIMHEEQRGNVSVSFLAPIPARAVREIVHLPGVLDSEGNRAVPVRFRAGPRHRDSVIFGRDAAQRLRRVVDRKARLVPLPSHGLALSRKLAEILAIDVGDTVTVEVQGGDRRVRTVAVTALVDDSFGLQGYMTLTSLHHLLGQEAAVTTVELRVDPARMAALERRLVDMPVVASVTRTENLFERVEQQTGQWMLATTLILTSFGMIIAIGVVYNNARIALSMRSHDLASLRVLGFTRAEISSILLGELAVQVIAALPLGLVLGTLWANAAMAGVDPETYRMPIIISARSYAFAIMVTGISGIISALLVRRKLDHLDLIAVLKTRE